MPTKSEGLCRFCQNSFASSSIGRHLMACKAKKEEDAKEKVKNQGSLVYHIRLSAYQAFWLHVEIDADSTLADLDSFLRRIWLECCGHLSQFTIKNDRYVSYIEEGYYDEDRNMNVTLKKVLNEKDKFTYEYDFGSTTEIEGKVLAIRKGRIKDNVKILARNKMPEANCSKCGANATTICVECYEIFCDTCIKKHPHEEEMTLPLVNSPRAGVCGYTGDNAIDLQSV
jgi:hypothetical protein